nr:hypothetical protein [Tanacetum cinerariifolium]
MPGQTQASTSHDWVVMRGTIARLMREEIEKLKAEFAEAAMVDNGGTIVRNPSENQRRNMQYSKATKIKFPKFGGDDVRGWLYKCEQLFRVDNVVDNQKVSIILILLYDIALMWHRQFLRIMGENVDWVETKEQDVSFFLAGLSDDIELAVRMFMPQTLSNAYSWAKLQEATNNAVRKKNKTSLLPTPSLAKKMRCNVKRTCPLQVTVARGKTMLSDTMINDFAWKLQGENFTARVMLLPVGDCDMVLGVQWLTTLGDIKFNFQELKMSFVYNGRYMNLMGSTRSTAIRMNAKQACKEVDRNDNVAMCVYPSAMLNMITASTSSLGSNEARLPPQRSYDHKIPLKEGISPINLKPYRHPPTQKDTIESMVSKLLETGVIRHSQSLFSSPVVMVKKKNRHWRMCIDYRQLNKHTIKEKFLIPLIGELIDELHGSMVYSKLDLRSGYHQIRMYEDDIATTAFKTHEGHYEFVVMPFGLINAPSTFQALMNDVFRPFLRKFTLVFFDDILVYSPTVDVHVAQLRLILKGMRTNKLYAKQSKCVFAAKQVEYLGHVITDKEVAIDPTKIQAMQQWLTPTD